MKSIDDNKQKNVPDADYEVSFHDYEKNIWFVEETCKSLQSTKVPNITIHIELGPTPPYGSIAWLNSKVGNKVSIPVMMNQPYSGFKKQFIKAGGMIFREINYKVDVKLSLQDDILDVNLFHEMRGR